MRQMYQIFVVEDELLIRQSIRNVIESMPGPYAFCGEASDGEMALSMMQEMMPDILLTDIRMPFLDGFELIRYARQMMPWLKIVIISGYDDFEYAQKAISLGVDQYLLKPVRAAELTRVIENMARQLEESKAQNMLPQGYNRDEVQVALHQHFMHQLLQGGAGTGKLLERARSLQLDILRPHYQTVICSFEGEEPLENVQVAVQNVLQKLKIELYYLGESGQLTLVLSGSDASALNEQVYQTVHILRHELREVCPVITIVIGSTVQRLSGIGDAYRAAAGLLKKVSSVSMGQVIDASDTAQITAELAGFSSIFGDAFQQKLRAASADDVPWLVDEVLNGPAGNQFNSVLVRYDALMDVFKMAVQLISRATPGVESKDVASQLSGQYDLFAASNRRESFRETAISLLVQAVGMKRENLSSMKYSHVISRAEKYVMENFCDPNISLISTARYVGMSAAHFSTVFSQSTGRSFIACLTAMRIERAKELLTGSNLKLASIAMEIGYNEPNYFSHVFRKLEGMTPKEYRARFMEQSADQ